jgi:hypothetical protein
MKKMDIQLDQYLVGIDTVYCIIARMGLKMMFFKLEVIQKSKAIVFKSGVGYY